MGVRENLFKIKERIASVCSKINRNPATVTIVGVAKGRTVEEVREALSAGITDIGENRVQEALLKYNQLRAVSHEPRAKWHMVGHLQTNKVKEVVRIFDLIHSVDSLHLAAEIDKQAAKINKVQDILIEVKTSPEETKSGLKPEEAIEVIKEAAELKNINIKGLMTIAPLMDDSGKTRPYFRTLRELRDKIASFGIWDLGFGILSMGMTDDFEVAVEEGSTMVRLGRAIFD